MINLIFDKFDKKLDKAISNSISVEQYNSLNSKDTSVHRIWNDYRFLMRALKLSDVSYNFISTENYYNNFLIENNIQIIYFFGIDHIIKLL